MSKFHKTLRIELNEDCLKTPNFSSPFPEELGTYYFSIQYFLSEVVNSSFFCSFTRMYKRKRLFTVAFILFLTIGVTCMCFLGDPRNPSDLCR